MLFTCPPKLSEKLLGFDSYNSHYQRVFKNEDWVLEGSMVLFITAPAPFDDDTLKQIPVQFENAYEKTINAIKVLLWSEGSNIEVGENSDVYCSYKMTVSEFLSMESLAEHIHFITIHKINDKSTESLNYGKYSTKLNSNNYLFNLTQFYYMDQEITVSETESLYLIRALDLTAALHKLVVELAVLTELVTWSTQYKRMEFRFIKINSIKVTSSCSFEDKQDLFVISNGEIKEKKLTLEECFRWTIMAKIEILPLYKTITTNLSQYVHDKRNLIGGRAGARITKELWNWFISENREVIDNFYLTEMEEMDMKRFNRNFSKRNEDGLPF